VIYLVGERVQSSSIIHKLSPFYSAIPEGKARDQLTAMVGDLDRYTFVNLLEPGEGWDAPRAAGTAYELMDYCRRTGDRLILMGGLVAAAFYADPKPLDRVTCGNVDCLVIPHPSRFQSSNKEVRKWVEEFC